MWNRAEDQVTLVSGRRQGTSYVESGRRSSNVGVRQKEAGRVFMWNRAEDQVTLVLIRHGETAANRERRYLGRTDEPLSREGFLALASYKEQKRYPDVDCLFSSPMKRCLETAKVIYPGLQPVIIPEWIEMDFGEFEYKNYLELKDDARYQAWIDSGGTLAFPGGESREAFVRRCERGFLRMCDVLHRRTELCSEKAVRAGMIVHGGTIMALMSLHDCAKSGTPEGSQNPVEDESDASGKKGYFDYQVANGGGYVCRMEMRADSVQPQYLWSCCSPL